MLKKSEIIELCKSIANDYPDWDYVAGAFKDKSLKHADKLVSPGWSFSPGSALSQPLAAIVNKKMNKIYTLVHCKHNWTHFIPHKKYYEEYNRPFRIYDIAKDKAEYRIRKLMDEGLDILEKTYDFSSEQALLESIPFSNEEKDGVMKCIVQCYLGDNEFVKRYYSEEIETKYPKRLDHVKKVMEHFGVEL